MASIPRHLLQALLLTLPGSAMAAPFCVATEALPAQCIIMTRDRASRTHDNRAASAW
jgi:hypothetical protein